MFSNLISTTCIHLSYQLFPDFVQQSYQHHLHTFILSAVSDCVQQSHQHHLNTFISSGTSWLSSTIPQAHIYLIRWLTDWLCSTLPSAPPKHIYFIRYFVTVFSIIISTTYAHLSHQVLPDCVQHYHQHHLRTFISSGTSWLCSTIPSAPPEHIYLIRYFLTVFNNPISTTWYTFNSSGTSWLFHNPISTTQLNTFISSGASYCV